MFLPFILYWYIKSSPKSWRHLGEWRGAPQLTDHDDKHVTCERKVSSNYVCAAILLTKLRGALRMPRRGIQGALWIFFSFALTVSALLVNLKNSYILQGHRLAPKPRFYAESRSVTETKAITSPSLGPCGRTHFTAANCHLRDPPSVTPS